MPDNHVSVVTWEMVRDSVRDANPDLAAAVTKLDESLRTARRGKKGAEGAPALYKISYPYGSTIVDKDGFVPPCGPVTDCKECAGLKDAVAYSPIPLSLVLANSVEVYFELRSGFYKGSAHQEHVRVVPLRLLKKGELFGVFETADILNRSDGSPLKAPWHVSAGARSAIVLAPTGSRRLADELIRLFRQCKVDTPESRDQLQALLRRDQAILIRRVGALAAPSWRTEILVFPKEWFSATQPSDIHLTFRVYLYETAWRQSRHLRDQAMTEAAELAAYSQVVGEVNSDADVDNTVRHLVRIAKGDAPGLTPTLTSDAGPFLETQEMLVDSAEGVFPSAEAFPFILQPTHLGTASSVAFYSLMHPMFISPIRKKPSNYAEMVDSVRSRVEIANRSNHSLIGPLDATLTQYYGDFRKVNGSLQVKSFDAFFESHAPTDFVAQLKVAARMGWDTKKSSIFSRKDAFNAFIRIVRR